MDVKYWQHFRRSKKANHSVPKWLHCLCETFGHSSLLCQEGVWWTSTQSSRCCGGMWNSPNRWICAKMNDLSVALWLLLMWPWGLWWLLLSSENGRRLLSASGVCKSYLVVFIGDGKREVCVVVLSREPQEMQSFWRLLAQFQWNTISVF